MRQWWSQVEEGGRRGRRRRRRRRRRIRGEAANWCIFMLWQFPQSSDSHSDKQIFGSMHENRTAKWESSGWAHDPVMRHEAQRLQLQVCSCTALWVEAVIERSRGNKRGVGLQLAGCAGRGRDITSGQKYSVKRFIHGSEDRFSCRGSNLRVQRRVGPVVQLIYRTFKHMNAASADIRECESRRTHGPDGAGVFTLCLLQLLERLCLHRLKLITYVKSSQQLPCGRGGVVSGWCGCNTVLLDSPPSQTAPPAHRGVHWFFFIFWFCVPRLCYIPTCSHASWSEKTSRVRRLTWTVHLYTEDKGFNSVHIRVLLHRVISKLCKTEAGSE